MRPCGGRLGRLGLFQRRLRLGLAKLGPSLARRRLAWLGSARCAGGCYSNVSLCEIKPVQGRKAWLGMAALDAEKFLAATADGALADAAE